MVRWKGGGSDPAIPSEAGGFPARIAFRVPILQRSRSSYCRVLTRRSCVLSTTTYHPTLSCQNLPRHGIARFRVSNSKCRCVGLSWKRPGRFKVIQHCAVIGEITIKEHPKPPYRHTMRSNMDQQRHLPLLSETSYCGIWDKAAEISFWNLLPWSERLVISPWIISSGNIVVRFCAP